MKNIVVKNFNVIIIISFIIITISFPLPERVLAQGEPEIDWIEGPTVVDLGDVAEIELQDIYVFADGEDAREILEQFLPRKSYSPSEFIQVIEQKHQARLSARRSHAKKQKQKLKNIKS